MECSITALLYIPQPYDFSFIVNSFQSNQKEYLSFLKNLFDDLVNKQVNIGIAMGLGSDLAIAAGNMILLDSNFASIVMIMENGRLVFDNLRKVILYLLPAGSWSELFPVLVNVLLEIPLPLSPFLLIVICCMYIYMLFFLFPKK